jgi:hypothetical protein
MCFVDQNLLTFWLAPFCTHRVCYCRDGIGRRLWAGNRAFRLIAIESVTLLDLLSFQPRLRLLDLDIFLAPFAKHRFLIVWIFFCFVPVVTQRAIKSPSGEFVNIIALYSFNPYDVFASSLICPDVFI